MTERDEIIPETVVSVNGAWKYSNFDTADDMYVSVPDATSKVPEIVTANAGRMNGGDFKWKFDNSVDDADHDVNQPLKSAILSYKSSLKAVQGET
ncbi:MAG: pectate lyase, partial [Muribaculaceae bacterium]|nr:pectate lyase [Muribaculaceae bacterium]